jgi:glycosyltransferase involved in cell wall biosynthesis
MPWRDIYPSFHRAVRGKIRKIRTRTAWRWFRTRASAFIAVSQFGAQEVARTFNLRREIVHPIYHGIDHDVFLSAGHKHEQAKPYLLHISRGATKKNVKRVIEAYKTLQKINHFNLMLVLPGYRETVKERGITVIREGKTPIELAALYRGARGFIFPSLHETFGMPIIEAMACGCPVITSRDTACAEVAGDAALLVDPRSVPDIAAALRRFMDDEPLLKALRQKGLARAQDFSWQKSAHEHLTVFQKLLEGRS